MLLKLDSITKSYGSTITGNLRRVLQDVSLEVADGQSIAILGPSGSGKTTLLNIIGSMDHPDTGTVFFKNENITSYSAQQLELYRSNHIGFIFQLHHLLPQCSLMENILIPVMTFSDKVEKANRVKHAEDLLKRVGIWDQRNQKPGHLSGGECQRTAVIRAMINSPELLLADEPSGALDSENALKLADLLVEINKEDKVALIVVTHSKSLAEKMDSLYELKNGRLVKIS